MKVTFKINYKTNWGEHIFISGTVFGNNGGQYVKDIPMTYTDDGNWIATTELEDCKVFSYKYRVFNDNKTSFGEWGHERMFYPIGEL